METSLKHLIFLVIFTTCAGFFISLGWVSQSKISQRYYLYHGLGTAALLAFAYWVLGEHSLGPSFDASMSLCIVAVGAFSFWAVRRPGFAFLLYGVGVLSILSVLFLDAYLLFPTGSAHFEHPGFFLGNLLVASLVLGFTMAAMILGHWYLIEPKLSIGELRRITLAMIVFLGVRLALSGFSSMQVLLPKSELEFYRFLFGHTQGIFLLMRWCWGIIAPLALSFFVWKTVQMRSTQSATGMLYVAVLFVLGGEIVGLYLTFFHGIPV